MIELHLRAQVAPGRRADLIDFLPTRFRSTSSRAGSSSGCCGTHTHDRDQDRVSGDPRMGEYLRRWRDLLAEPPRVETYRIEGRVRR